MSNSLLDMEETHIIFQIHKQFQTFTLATHHIPNIAAFALIAYICYNSHDRLRYQPIRSGILIS